MKEIKQVAIDEIRIDGGTQLRAEIDQAAVDDYAEHVDELPPSIVYFDGCAYWLGDGFHRLYAHRKANKKKMICEVRTGTRHVAFLFALGANHSHGLRRTVADKKKSVESAFADDETGKLSDRKISELCGVSVSFVGDTRKRICSPTTDARTVERGGKQFEMKTSGISKSNESRTKPKTDDPDPDEFFPKNGKHTAKKPEPLKDEEGQEITNPKLVALWNRRCEIDEMLSSVSRIRSTVKKAGETKDALFAHITISQVQADCGNLYRALRFAKPYAVCPYCGGSRTNCKPCKGTGFVGEEQFKHFVPEDLKV